MPSRISLKSLMEENDYAGSNNEEVLEIPLSDIKPNPYQPRYIFDDEKIDELAKSIKEHGVFQPIIVKKMNGYYSIISGERRYRACEKLGLKTIPAIIRMYENSKMIELALIENLQREDLTPVEEAKAYRQIMRELNYTQAELGERVGKSRSYVTNILGLLELPEEVLNLVDSKKISMGHARALSKLSDKKRIIELAKIIVDKNLSVREIEELAQEEKKRVVVKKKAKRLEQYKSYEKTFKDKYNGRLKVVEGKITITLDNDEFLEDILNKLCK